MKKNDILFILFLGTLWGASEAILGGALYAADVPRSSVLLAIIALAVLTLARAYRPQIGMATLLAIVAMAYKAAGMLLARKLGGHQIFLCHCWGVLTLGIAYDVMRLVWRDKQDSLFAVSAVYFGYAFFALTMTYVFRYSVWPQEGVSKVINHVLISGSIAAIGSAVIVPIVAYLAQALKSRQAWPFAVPSRLSTSIVSLLLLGLWVLGLVVSF